MVSTYVWSSWMIYIVVLLHCTFICLAMESGMTLTDALESTKQLWTLKLNNSNDNKNGGQSEFASSMRRALRTNVSDLGDLLGPLLEEETLSMEVFPSACKRISRRLVSSVNS